MNPKHEDVAQQLFNDERLYQLVNRAQSVRPNKREQARYILETLHKNGITETPGGAKYTAAAIYSAL